MITYQVCTEEGRNKTLTKQFDFRFEREPQAGDIIISEGERWTCLGRLWGEYGGCVLLARRQSGLVPA